MQITEKFWDKYAKAQSKLCSTAKEKMAEQIAKYGLDDRKKLIESAYAIATKYGEGSSALACQMYDTVAEASGVYVDSAIPAEGYTYSEVAKAINGSINTGSEAIVSSCVATIVKTAGADTILENVQRDEKNKKVTVQFAWVPRGGETCAFCIALASKGWQTIHGASALDENTGHAEHIHDNCDCTYMVRFSDDTDLAGYDPGYYQSIYNSAKGKTSAEKIRYIERQHYEEIKDERNAKRRAEYALRKKQDEGKSNTTDQN